VQIKTPLVEHNFVASSETAAKKSKKKEVKSNLARFLFQILQSNRRATCKEM